MWQNLSKTVLLLGMSFALSGCAAASAQNLAHETRPLENISYIMLHDTEVEGDADDIVRFWTEDGKQVASHFVIDKEGSVESVVPINKTAWHAGLGYEGAAADFGIEDFDSTEATDCDSGMNSASIGIELCHMPGEKYTEEQIEALKALIADINSQLGKEAKLIGHKEWKPSKTDPDGEIMEYILEVRAGKE